jgi:SAM-dependent methyltransferase
VATARAACPFEIRVHAVSRWTRRNWEELARQNALGAILTGDSGSLREWQLEEFFATGRADAAAYFHRLDELAPNAPRQRVLDFGCGVGRVSRALADYVPEVIGVDASASMIRLARVLNVDIPQCRFVTIRGTHLRRFRARSFDLVYSRLVFQHIPPHVVRRYIAEMIRTVAPGGIVTFQLPEQIDVDPVWTFCEAPVTGSRLKRTLPRPLVRLYRRVKYRILVGSPPGGLRMFGPAGMRMFGMSRDEVVASVETAGGRIVAIDDDHSHGTSHAGFQYWITRAEPGPAQPLNLLKI